MIPHHHHRLFLLVKQCTLQGYPPDCDEGCGEVVLALLVFCNNNSLLLYIMTSLLRDLHLDYYLF